MELVVEWPSNVSGQNPVKGIQMVAIDQTQEYRFFLPLIFFTDVVIAIFDLKKKCFTFQIIINTITSLI
jgi:hypothetical protein